MPQARPAKKCWSLRSSPNPYTELGRRSIFDIIQVTKRVMRKGTDSPTKPNSGDISFGGPAVLGGGGWRMRPIRFAQKAMAAKIARKISRLQPARRPSLPMKILWTAEGCVGGRGSVTANVASIWGGWSPVSLFKGFLVWRQYIWR